MTNTKSQKIETAIEMLRRAEGTKNKAVLTQIAEFIHTLNDAEAIEVIAKVEAEKLKAPRNLYFNYETQTWRI